MSVVADLAAYSTFAIHIIWIIAFAAFMVNKSHIGVNSILQKPRKVLESYSREISLFIAVTATSGSLYFSEILMLEPCPLCWYQRIFMYPLVVLFLTALVMMKEDIHIYTVPITLIGAGVAAYHYAVQMVDELSSGCTVGASCEATHLMYFDYITIPLMAFTAFITLLIINLVFTGQEKEKFNF